MLLAVSGERGLDAACALELVHTYSLIHDDLPCMDDDDVRRGKPSLHVVFGEANAILTGDFLLTLAFEVLATASYSSELVTTFARGIGSKGMVGGQVLDIAAKNVDIDFNSYQKLTLLKTSALYALALECGALISGLSEEEKELLIQFGRTYGLIFQIVDDLQDDDSPSAKFILGSEKAKEVARTLIAHAKHLLNQLREPYPFLYESLTDLEV